MARRQHARPRRPLPPELAVFEEELQKCRGEFQRAERALQDVERRRQDAAIDLVRKTVGPDVDVWVGSYWCAESPILVCAYDDQHDRCHDLCLFCGEPEERK